MVMRISDAEVKNCLDAILDLLDVGGNGRIEWFNNSSPGVNNVTTHDLLATTGLSATGFQNSTIVVNAADAVHNTIQDDLNVTGGTCGWARFQQNATAAKGAGVFDVSVGTSGTDFIIGSDGIVWITGGDLEDLTMTISMSKDS